MHNRHDFHVHRTSSDPESLVDEKIDDKDFFLNVSSVFKHATIKLYLTLSHVGLVAHRTIEAMRYQAQAAVTRLNF